MRATAWASGQSVVPCVYLAALHNILCDIRERTVGRDNCVRFEGRVLQLPANRYRLHYAKARANVRRRADSTLSVWHNPRRLARYDAGGAALERMALAAG